MRKLIIFRGNSGSGKTTVAKELQNKFGLNTMLISQDVIRREILHVKDGKNTEVIPFMEQLLKYGNANCEVVILEGIMVADWYQPLFELAVGLYGKEIYAYYFDLPFEETLKRHQTRSKCQEFGEKDMKRWWVEKDYSNILSEKIITKEQSMEAIVEGILLEIDIE